MTVLIAPPPQSAVAKEIRAMRKASKKIMSSRASARKFLIKSDFITKKNQLHARYRGGSIR
jgi:hypothetical protein